MTSVKLMFVAIAVYAMVMALWWLIMSDNSGEVDFTRCWSAQVSVAR